MRKAWMLLLSHVSGVLLETLGALAQWQQGNLTEGDVVLPPSLENTARGAQSPWERA